MSERNEPLLLELQGQDGANLAEVLLEKGMRHGVKRRSSFLQYGEN